VRPVNFTNRSYRNPARRHQQHHGHNRRRERFRLAMPVRVIFVGRLSRHHQPAPDDNRTEDVGQGFDRVRDQSMRMTQNAGRQFAAGQNRIYR